MVGYPKILSLGDPLLENLFTGEYVIEEKLDGSLMRFWLDEKGQEHFGSKSVNYSDERPVDKMFELGVSTIKELLAKKGMGHSKNIFFAFEYFQKKKQNTLDYDRVPKQHILLLDVFHENKIDTSLRSVYAQKWDLEVPVLLKRARDSPPSKEVLDELLEKESMLGGQKIEGIVIKNYSQKIVVNNFSQPCFGKFVREEFKEMNRENWGQGVSLEEKIMSQFQKTPRWEKAMVHARERGELTYTPKDIGLLLEEIEKDFSEECREIIKADLWQHYKRVFTKMTIRGFAEWYKEKLLEKQIKGKTDKTQPKLKSLKNKKIIKTKN